MSEPSVRTVGPGDFEQIEALKRRFGLPAYSEAEWRHLYEGNPLLERRDIDWPWGWVLEAADGMIHGHLGNVPVEYSFRGRSVAAAAASDWVVEESHRGRSLQLLLEFFRQSAAELLLNTSAAPEYGRAYAALGAEQPPLSGYDQTLVWPVRHRATAAAALREIGRPAEGPLATLAGAALVPVSVAGKVLRAPAAGLGRRVERCDRFDDRFDRLWEQLRRDGELVCVRDSAGLLWRYGLGLDRGDVWIHVLPGAAGISAYLLVGKTTGDPDQVRARVLDYQDTEPSRRRAAALLASALRRAREEGVTAIQAVGIPSQARRRLRSLGALPRRTEPRSFFFKAADPALQQALGRAGTWNPSPYDGDGPCSTPQFFGLGD